MMGDAKIWLFLRVLTHNIYYLLILLKERFMRTLSIILILGTLTACASSGFLEFRPAHWEGQDWAITGKADIGAEKDFIIIKVNNEDAIVGSLSKDKPEDVFTGNFEDYQISAKCKLLNAGKGDPNHSCEVSVNGDSAGKLSF